MLDQSVLRRGVPTAHKIYGFPSTINAATYAHFVAFNRVHNLYHPKAILLCTENIVRMYQGQGMEIYFRDNHMCPYVKEYEDIAKRSKDSLRTVSRIQLDITI
jgi:geranylgeranyl diphosphate synthase type 3